MDTNQQTNSEPPDNSQQNKPFVGSDTPPTTLPQPTVTGQPSTFANPPNDNNMPTPPSSAPPQAPSFNQQTPSQSFQSAQSTPNNMPPAPQPPHDSATNAGLIVLQWLTYAFWGWTVLGMSILTATVLANYINDVETGGFTPYGIAAVLVLLPISIACDVFYSKKEQQKKTGAASIVMVIHAVIFALFGIGAVISMVISMVTLLTSSSDKSNSYVFLFSSMIIAVLYGAVFLRTLNPKKLPFIRKFFIIFMTVVVGLIALLGILGPFARERATRDDRLIKANLSSLKSDIDNYAEENKELPRSLSELDIDGDTKQLVDRNLVKYTPNLKSPTTTTSGTSRLSTSRSTYYYELCVTYAEDSKSGYSSSYRDRTDKDGYVTYIDTYGDHDAGEKCYKVASSSYGY